MNTSSRYALIALQGPVARDVLQTLTGVDLDQIKYYWFTTGEVASVRVHDFAHRLHGRRRVRSLRAAGDRPSASGTRSCERGSGAGSSRPGLARATRCGSKRRCVSTATTWTRRPPCSKRISGGLSAGRRPDSSARTCCSGRSRTASPQACRVRDARPRHRAAWLRRLSSTGQKAGVVTSGTQTPFLKKAIGMAYVPIDHAAAAPTSRSTSRPARFGARRSDAVLQAREIGRQKM